MKYYYHRGGLCPTMTSPDHAVNIIDRTQTILPNISIAVYTPIGKLVTPKSVAELFHTRASEIITIAAGRKIAVAWSGGIDSTSILVEFLKLVPNDQLIILLNDFSIREYPEFYRRYIDGKIEQRLFDLYSDNFMDAYIDECVIVTGILFDRVMGDSLFHALTEDDLKMSTASFLNSVNVASREMYSTLFAACPRPLETLKDISWWQSYALNWQSGEMVWLLLSEKLRLESNMFNFCTSPDWNDYAVSAPMDEKWPGYQQIHYKWPLKQHIFEFTQDSQYRDNKCKVFSWRRYRTAEQWKKIPIYITTDWKRGYAV
jgi:hypothetical protein